MPAHIPRPSAATRAITGRTANRSSWAWSWDSDDFPKAHEVFDGSRVDRTTVADILTMLESRNTGRLRDEAKVHQAIGRRTERYPRVAPYYAITYDAVAPTVTWAPHEDKRRRLRSSPGDLPSPDVLRSCRGG